MDKPKPPPLRPVPDDPDNNVTKLRALPQADALRRKRAQSIRFMASTKTEVKAMAEILGISPSEIYKEFRRELNNGRDVVYGAISLKLVNSAIAGDMRSMLAWLRQFGGWHDVTRRELVGKNGEPISLADLDTASVLAVAQALGSRSAGASGRGRTGEATGFEPVEPIEENYMDSVSGTTDEGLEQQG
jgi:hypothetical protein